MALPRLPHIPLVNLIADTTPAILERRGSQRRPSTRFKDLVDLVAVITQLPIPAESQATVLHSEAQRRALSLPNSFTVPDQDLRERGYPAEARRAVAPRPAMTLDEALAITGRFLNSLLDGTDVGIWDPHMGHRGNLIQRREPEAPNQPR